MNISWTEDLFMPFISFLAAATRWSTMTHVGEVQATGTVCSGLNTWPQGVTWLLRWVRCVTTFFHFFFLI